MTSKKILNLILIVLFISFLPASLPAQSIDTSRTFNFSDAATEARAVPAGTNHSLYKKMVLPAVLTSYGYLALGNEELKEWDHDVKDKVWNDHPHQPNHFDDWLQYMPGFSVYVLNSLGYKGKNNLLDATRQYLLSSLAMTIVVQTTKRITGLRRPDGFGNNTFPSGHTAVAFVAAEFLNQEYKDRSVIIPAIGYTAAVTVGYMRLYNNRHWFKDIISGAGIGMGITKLVYWYYPRIKQKFWPEKKHLPAPSY